MTLNPQYITDKAGNRNAVVLPIKEYNRLLEELEELKEWKDLQLYDEAKKSDDGTRVTFDKYIKQRKSRKR